MIESEGRVREQQACISKSSVMWRVGSLASASLHFFSLPAVHLLESPWVSQ